MNIALQMPGISARFTSSIRDFIFPGGSETVSPRESESRPNATERVLPSDGERGRPNATVRVLPSGGERGRPTATERGLPGVENSLRRATSERVVPCERRKGLPKVKKNAVPSVSASRTLLPTASRVRFSRFSQFSQRLPNLNERIERVHISDEVKDILFKVLICSCVILIIILLGVILVLIYWAYLRSKE